MKIVIYGANETACLIAAKLYEDHDIIVIADETSANDDIQKLDIEYIQGSGANIALLESIGIKDPPAAIVQGDFSTYQRQSANRQGRCRRTILPDPQPHPPPPHP